MKMKCVQWGLVLVGLAATVGCGGSGSAGTNMNVRIVITTNFESQIRDLNLVVGREQASFSNPGNCSLANQSFCNSVFKSITDRRIEYTFRTRSSASERPFHVYVQNTDDNENRPYRLRIFMDDQLIIDQNYTIPWLTIDRVARVFRNSVSGG